MSGRYYEVSVTAGGDGTKLYQVALVRQYCESKDQQIAEQTAVRDAVEKALKEAIAKFE